MSKLETEQQFKLRTGHSSLCNCVRDYRGKLVVTRRQCSCGGFGMTLQKAMQQAIGELGPITEINRDAIVRRRDELLQRATASDDKYFTLSG